MPSPALADPRPSFTTARGSVAHAATADEPEQRRAEPLWDAALASLVSDVLAATEPSARRRAVWLLLVALTGALPGVNELEDALVTADTSGVAHLVASVAGARPGPGSARPASCVTSTLIDVSTTARTDNQAGVPRVVRSLVAEWGEPAGTDYVVWDEAGLRTLAAEERQRLGLAGEAPRPPGSWVVPWECRYVVTEVLRPEEHAAAVEAMALAGVVDLRAIAYDLAALIEPHPDAARGPFLHHLSALAAGSRVSGISAAVAADVSDYLSVFTRNGRPVPEVTSHVLPESAEELEQLDAEVTALSARLRGDADWPVVLVVSSIHRRKNHGRLLVACERLWQQGVRFRLLMVEGTGSRLPAVSAAVTGLVERGRPLTTLSRVPESTLRAAYRLAHVTAYVSLAEGYGLPIVESLAAGTPALSSGHGSMAEVAAPGGVLLVDPRDEDAIALGLRRVLEEPGLHARLVTEAAARPRSDWAAYAARVGEFLGVLSTEKVA
jgi:glycosyltransferase involved in cell wall biosynthesis